MTDRELRPYQEDPNATGNSVEFTRQAIDENRKKVLLALEQARLLPDNWQSVDGRSRDEIIQALERSLEELDLLEPKAPQQPRSQQEQQESHYFADVGQYITIGNVHIPICQPPQDNPAWEAVPGKVFVSGGKKFSEVHFVKDVGGLTHTAKPGEPLSFSEKHRGERLASIDTVLEGRNELIAFNEALALLGRLAREYQQLNPDGPGYDAAAAEIAANVEKLLHAEGIKELIDLEKKGIEDVDGFAERAADIIRMQQFLRSIDESLNEFVPPKDTHFKLTPYFERKLAWFATLINRQLGLGNNAFLESLVTNEQAPAWEKLSAKGMTVIVGPRGTGKNKLVDFYCAETNRPLFRYACSPDKEERDLTYDIELSDGEVVRIPTRILTAITTPNAVLELDELNLLRPNIAKFFNSLFDGDRTIFLNDQLIKAAPGVVFVGLMNPAGYDGVEDLPETIDDRSSIMTMGYPPFREIDSTTSRERFTFDEALILKEHIHPLAEFTDDEFKAIWDFVINGVSAKVSLDSTIITIVKDLKNLVAIADRTRQVVEAYKTRTGDTRMERDISLRGSIEAARFYSENHLWEANIPGMPGWKAGWNAAQYAVAMTYLPHTDTYRKGRNDKDAIMLILAEGVR